MHSKLYAKRKSFRRYKIWGECQIEATQIEVFGKMFFQNHIYKGWKLIQWSPSSGTTLAKAELEYLEGHISRSVYAICKVVNVVDTTADFLKGLLPSFGLAI